MKTTLGFLTEEGRTRRKNAARRICVYAAVMFLFAGAGAYGIHRYWVSLKLTTMQRVYFKQYLKSTCRSYLPNTKSQYTTLARTVINPSTRKEVSLAVKDDDIVPVLDEEGHIQLDKDHRPKLLLKDGIEHKLYYWAHGFAGDKYMHDWFQQTIYDGQTITDIWRPAWLGALLIFCFGTVGLGSLDVIAQHHYLKGEAIRGTRELSAKAYAREHRNHLGSGITIYA